MIGSGIQTDSFLIFYLCFYFIVVVVLCSTGYSIDVGEFDGLPGRGEW